MFVIKLIAAVVCGALMYIIGFNAVVTVMPVWLATIVAIGAGLTVASLIMGLGK